MRMRIISGVVVLCAAACLVSFGRDRTPSRSRSRPRSARADAAAAAAGNESNDPKQSLPAAPKRHTVKKPAAPHATEAEDRASETAIRAQSLALVAEYNAKNPDAFAAHFLPNAEYEMDSGDVIIGRQAIEEHFAELFEKHPEARAELKESRVRLISLHTAIEEGTVAVVRSPDEEEATCPYVAIWNFLEGRWSLASARELLDEGGGLTAHEHLLDLAWLVGDWVDESDESVVKTSCRWSDDGNFLLQDFTVKVLGADVMSGSQRIGWDPLTEKVRGWIFDSRGGFGESHWNWDGERWVIRSSAVRDDGQTAASLNFLIPLGNDSYRWEASHRMSGDENLPDVSVLIVRQAPLPAAALTDESDK
ncbi:MAG: SgcJ/EcaC family oxidoreductase [Deltaproteobacteria bacterium]